MTRVEALDGAEASLKNTPVTRACLEACTEGDLRVIASGISSFLAGDELASAVHSLSLLMLTPPTSRAPRAGQTRKCCRYCRSTMHFGDRCPQRDAAAKAALGGVRS